MAVLTYGTIMSLDGYIEDKQGRFDWAAPDDEVHQFVNDLCRTARTYLYGRRMYETMAAWETDPSLASDSPSLRDFAEIWRAADKIVFSRTLSEVATSRTRIEREFEPASVRRLKAGAASDILIGGPELASHAFRVGLVDECHMFVVPVAVGGGKRALPADVRLGLTLDHQRRFGNGTVFLRYRVGYPELPVTDA